jgi:scyllo-inositol 2-dehydrogenase (NADP+)
MMAANERAPVGVAVVGYGYAGRTLHAALVREVAAAADGTRLRLHGVLARRAEQRERAQADHPGIAVYSDMPALLADPRVELVIVATPPATHAALAGAALAAGRHVVVDKPLCLSLEECDTLAGLAATHGRLFTVFQNRRWDGDFLTVQRVLGEGTLGEVTWLEMAWHKFGASANAWKNVPAAAGGGVLLDLGAHCVDQALLLFPGPTASVHCRMHTPAEGGGSETHAVLTLAWADGRTAIIDTCAQSLMPKPRFQLYGTRGTLVKHGLDPQEAALARGDASHSAHEPPAAHARVVLAASPTTEVLVPTVPGDWARFYPDVAASIRAGPPYAPPVTVASVRRALAVLLAALESAATGRVVALSV